MYIYIHTVQRRTRPGLHQQLDVFVLHTVRVHKPRHTRIQVNVKMNTLKKRARSPHLHQQLDIFVFPFGVRRGALGRGAELVAGLREQLHLGTLGLVGLRHWLRVACSLLGKLKSQMTGRVTICRRAALLYSKQ